VSASTNTLHLPVQDHPTEPTLTWPTLAAALDTAQADTIYASIGGIPVAF
jgi:hypothetical protein